MRFFASMGTLAIASLTLGAHAGIIDINEVRTGPGNAEYIELKGPAGQSLAGYALVIIGDGTTSGATPTRSGVVEWLYRFASTDVIGPNGFLVLRNPGQNPANANDTSGVFPFTVAPGATDLPWGYQASGLAADTQIESPDNQTYLLVTGYTGTDTFQTRAPNQGAGGQDLDTNDDGVLDVTPWKAIVDSVVLKESSGDAPGSGQDWWYGTVICGPFVSRQLVTSTTGTVVAGWDFQTTTNSNNGTAAAAQPATPKAFRSNAGVGTMYLDGTNGSSDWLQATELNAFTGTGVNATGTGAGGNGLDPSTSTVSSLALQSGGTGTPANGKSFTLKFSMVGISGLNVSYATRTSGATSGFTTHTWAWSTDGSSWTDIDVFTPFTTTFTLKSLAPLGALDGVTDAYLRCTVTGATTPTSNNRFDNMVLLSNPVSSDTVVTSYLGPIHGIKTSTGAWVLGVASTTTGSRDTPGAPNVDPVAYACGDAGAGDCSVAHDNASCADACCCEEVCTKDPFCCEVRWDAICVTAAASCSGDCGGDGCPSDIDGDGVTDGNDLGTLLGAWGPGTGPADLNFDGVVDGNDLGILLGAWGPCSGG
jgi:hypothetical protein